MLSHGFSHTHTHRAENVYKSRDRQRRYVNRRFASRSRFPPGSSLNSLLERTLCAHRLINSLSSGEGREGEGEAYSDYMERRKMIVDSVGLSNIIHEITMESFIGTCRQADGIIR